MLLDVSSKNIDYSNPQKAIMQLHEMVIELTSTLSYILQNIDTDNLSDDLIKYLESLK